MLKYLLIGVLLIWLLYSPLLKRMRQLRRDRPASRPATRPSPPPAAQVEDMVACAHCGLHMPQADAVTDTSGQSFCSADIAEG